MGFLDANRAAVMGWAPSTAVAMRYGHLFAARDEHLTDALEQVYRSCQVLRDGQMTASRPPSDSGWPTHCRPSQAFAPTTGDAQDQQNAIIVQPRGIFELSTRSDAVPGALACVARRPASGTPVASSQPRSLITARRERPRNRPSLLSQPLRRPTNPAIPNHDRAGLSF
jgi:hypothetical protein